MIIYLSRPTGSSFDFTGHSISQLYDLLNIRAFENALCFCSAMVDGNLPSTLEIIFDCIELFFGIEFRYSLTNNDSFFCYNYIL